MKRVSLHEADRLGLVALLGWGFIGGKRGDLFLGGHLVAVGIQIGLVGRGGFGGGVGPHILQFLLLEGLLEQLKLHPLHLGHLDGSGEPGLTRNRGEKEEVEKDHRDDREDECVPVPTG